MRLEFCDKKINFGDTLNEWLWPKIIDAEFKDNDQSFFLGIGTILTSKRIKEIETKGAKQVTVFSPGTWGTEPILLKDKKWKFYGVRGPRTAKALGLTEDFITGDGAYLLRNFYPDSDQKGKAIGFIPHHGSEIFVDWSDICQKAGLKYISPQQQPENFISDLYECESVITEAMHGAIAADALRIPWKAVKFSPSFSSFKWYDWAEALNIELNIHDLPFLVDGRRVPLNRILEDFFKYYANKILLKKESKRLNVYHQKRLCKNHKDALVNKLIELKTSYYQLSDTKDLTRITDKLNATVKQLNQDIKNGVVRSN